MSDDAPDHFDSCDPWFLCPGVLQGRRGPTLCWRVGLARSVTRGRSRGIRPRASSSSPARCAAATSPTSSSSRLSSYVASSCSICSWRSSWTTLITSRGTPPSSAPTTSMSSSGFGPSMIPALSKSPLKLCVALRVSLTFSFFQRPYLLLWDVWHAEEHWSSSWLWKQVSWPPCLQETDPDEPANRRWRNSPLHNNAFCPHTRGLTDLRKCKYISNIF